MKMDHVYQTLGNYSWLSLYRPEIFLLLAALGFVYFYYTNSKRADLSIKAYQKLFIVLALILTYLIEGTPIAILGHMYLFSIHMLQMAILYLMVVPLVILGIPSSWWEKLFMRSHFLNKIFSFMTHPLIALLVFNSLFSFYHVPGIFNAVSESMPLHYGYHFTLLVTAFTMWWPIFCPIPEMGTLSELQKLGYIFANGVLITPACALIMFAHNVLYSTYAHIPPMYQYMDPMDDQMVGGIMMKIIQEIVYGTVLGWIFYQWVRKERAQDKIEMVKIKESVIPKLGNIIE